MSQTPHSAAPAQTSAPSVCVVVLNYNGRRLLGRFLPPIMKTDYAPLEVVVVDNASHDDSCGWLKARWPQVTLLKTTRNLGFAGGNNAGIRYALERGHRYVVIANNDIEPHPSWVREAVAHAQAHPRHGIIGFNLFNQDVTRPAFETACRNLGPIEARPSPHVVGAAMFCDCEVFRSIGFFDETYRFYSEETDLELRATAAGWEMVELNVPVWHLAEGSTRKLGLKRAYLQMRNAVRMHFKLHGLLAGLKLCKTVLNRACNPWLRLDTTRDYTLNRYRPAGLATNATLALGAIGWNLLKLPQSLRAGREARRPERFWSGPATAAGHAPGHAPDAAAPPSVCMVILNYNGRALLERFLPSLARTDYQPLELVVVDNASTDDSVAWLHRHWPQVTVLTQTRNRYWAGGNNVGIRYALARGHRYIVFANNDIEPHPAWIREAVALVTKHPDVEIVGFRLFSRDRERADFEQACRQWQTPAWQPPLHVEGCSLFCSSALFRRLGHFDETYRIYAEETDFEERAKLAGCRMMEVNVPVWHYAEGTMNRVPLQRAYLQMRNIIRFHLKLRGIWRGLIMAKTVLNRACNPWLRLDTERDHVLKRFRPAGLLTNTALALMAAGWNLLALPWTLQAGRRDRARATRHHTKEVA